MRSSPGAAAVCLLVWSATARADGSAGSAGSGEVIVVTGTRTPESADIAPVKVDVITHDEADRRGATNVAEALATEPGVQVNPGAYGYLGGPSAIQIQGFDLNRVLILEDNEPVIGDVGGAIDLAAIPTSDIERVEVVTGPTSALYGSSALGGVVNILTSAPKRRGWSGRARVQYRNHDGVLADGTGAYRASRWWAALDLSYFRQSGIAEDPSLPDWQIPKTARSGVGVRGGTRVGRADLELRARWLHENLEGRQSVTYPGLGTFTQATPELVNRYALHAFSTIDVGAASNVRLAAALQHATDTSSTIGAGTDQVQRTWETAPSAEATATLADGPRTWVAGARFETEHLTQALEDRETAMASTEQEIVPRWLWTAAAYGQLQWRLASTLAIVPGVRVEDHGAYGAVVAPRLAIAIWPADALTLRVAGGRGYRTPSAEELGFNFDHSIYGYKVLGNAALSPESSWGADVDATYRPIAQLALRAGGFANWVDNLIAIDLADGMTSGTVVTYTYENDNKARTMGADVSATWRIGERVQLDAAYDYLWTRDDVAHTPLEGFPPHTVTGAALVHLPWRLDAYARARWVAGSYVDAMTRSPGYETVNVQLSRPIWRDLVAELGGNNLFDVHQTPGAVGDLRPPLGRVLYAGVRAAFP